MKHYVLSLCLMLSSTIKSQDDCETLQLKKQSNTTLSKIIPVVATVAIGGLMAYTIHSRVPDLTVITVNAIKDSTQLHNITNNTAVANIYQRLNTEHWRSWDQNKLGLKIGFRKHFYSLSRTYKEILDKENVQKLIQEHRSNNFWLFFRNSDGTLSRMFNV